MPAMFAFCSKDKIPRLHFSASPQSPKHRGVLTRVSDGVKPYLVIGPCRAPWLYMPSLPRGLYNLQPARYIIFLSFASSLGRMKNIPGKSLRYFAKTLAATPNDDSVSDLTGGGQSTQGPRPSLTPLRPTTQRVEKPRGPRKTKKPPDRRKSTETFFPHCEPTPDILSSTSSRSFLPIMDSYNLGSPSSDPQDDLYFFDESYFWYSPPPVALENQNQNQPNLPRRRWRRQPPANMESVPLTFNRRFECLTRGNFVTRFTNASVNYDGILLSQLYRGVSYIWLETVMELGFGDLVIPGQPPLSMDPRTGRTLEPIGWLPLRVELAAPEHASPQYVWFGVLPGSPAATGVRAIIAGPDLDNFFGPDFDMERYNRERGA
ncbi:hypothetical protein QBC38DRAFT_463164 [Podospora fimiseda]|uniref:Uncharacterized protein n=1 Tax=Podospora fimiseda TaxID=252190 RepID=A0AAN7H2P4_9PEZI|nr:hypothetical protein QBC38DRAFT_463164 [Podospora fimiseda]